MQKALGGFLSLVVPLLCFLVLLCLSIQSSRAVSDGLAFTDDASYVQCKLVEQVDKGSLPGLSNDQVSPMTRRGLYTVSLSLIHSVTGNLLSAVYLLGAVAGFLTLVTARRLATAFGLPAGLSLLGVVLIVCHPQFVQAALEANGDGLFVLLVTYGLYRFWVETRRGDLGLSITGLLPIALAAAIHVEAVLFLVWMGLMAIGHQLLGRKDAANAAAGAISVVTGVFLVGLCLAPAVIFHMEQLSVPWPRYADAVLAVTTSGEITGTGTASGNSPLSSLITHGPLAMPWPGPLTFFAVLSGLVLLSQPKRSGALETLSFLVIPAGLAGFMIPITGKEGLDAFALAMTPAWILLALKTCSEALHLARDRFHFPDIRWKGWPVPALGFGGLFLIFGLLALGVAGQTRSGELARLEAQRNKILPLLSSSSGSIASDRPGWLALSQENKVVDLTGHHSIQVLSRMDGQGNLSAEDWRVVVEREQVTSWVLWTTQVADALRQAGVVDLPANDADPRLMVQGRPVSL